MPQDIHIHIHTDVTQGLQDLDPPGVAAGAQWLPYQAALDPCMPTAPAFSQMNPSPRACGGLKN